MDLRAKSRLLWTVWFVGLGAVVQAALGSPHGGQQRLSYLATGIGAGVILATSVGIRLLRCPVCHSPAWGKSFALGFATRTRRVECQFCSAELR